jgi:ribosomal protein S18 acetylase RimI-like enzyme
VPSSGKPRISSCNEKIGLSVFATNVNAIRLYKTLGFVEEGRQPREFKVGDGLYADNVLMYRIV